MIKSEGIASDLLVMRGRTLVEEYNDHFVFRTPTQPDFWWGNCVIEKMPPLSPEAPIKRFQEALPDSNHLVVGWDIPDFRLGAMADWYTERGYEIDSTIFMSVDGDINRFDMPEGIEARPLDGDADWDQLIELQYAIGVELGFGASNHYDYLRGRNKTRREQIANDEGQWFGAFDGDTLVAALGIFHDDRVARYQAVETKPEYRRRGISSGLLCVAYDWAKSRAPHARVLIATDEDGDARRVYERLGFETFQTITGVIKRAY